MFASFNTTQTTQLMKNKINQVVDKMYEAYLYSIKLNTDRTLEAVMGKRAHKALKLDSEVIEKQVASLIEKCRPEFDKPMKAALKKLTPEQLQALDRILDKDMVEAMSDISMKMLPAAMKALPTIIESMSTIDDDACLA